MKNTETFRMLNGLDEAYIKEADLLLSAPEKSVKSARSYKKRATVLRVLIPAVAAIALLTAVLTLTFVLRQPTSSPPVGAPGTNDDPAQKTEHADQDDLTYVKYDDHVVITAFAASDATVEIPSKIEGLPVTSANVKKGRKNAAVEHINVYTDSPEFTTLTLPEGCTCTLIAGADVEYLEPSLLRNSQILRVEVDELNDVYTAVDGILYSKDLQYLVACPAGTKLKTLGTDPDKCDSVFPQELQIVSARAFEDCLSLVSVTLPESVLIVDRRAFFGCTALKEIAVSAPIDCASDFVSGCIALKRLYTDLDAKAFAAFSVKLPEGAELVAGTRKNTRTFDD